MDVVPLDIQIQIAGEELISRTRSEQVDYIEGLMFSLTESQIALGTLIEQLEAEIQVFEGRLAKAKEERVRLEAESSLARETYETMARKAQETRITALDQEVVARVASRAITPLQPVQPNIRINVAIGTILGLLFGVAWAFILELWGMRAK